MIDQIITAEILLFDFCVRNNDMVKKKTVVNKRWLFWHLIILMGAYNVTTGKFTKLKKKTEQTVQAVFYSKLFSFYTDFVIGVKYNFKSGEDKEPQANLV